MKKVLLIVTLLAFSLGLKAQQTNTQKTDSTIYAAVETEPSFPGGQERLNRFLKDNIKPTGDKGRVFIMFIVEKDGSLSDIKVVRHLSDRADKQATDAFSKSPDWNPGTQNGKPVRVRYTIPIAFN